MGSELICYYCGEKLIYTPCYVGEKAYICSNHYNLKIEYYFSYNYNEILTSISFIYKNSYIKTLRIIFNVCVYYYLHNK